MADYWSSSTNSAETDGSFKTIDLNNPNTDSNDVDGDSLDHHDPKDSLRLEVSPFDTSPGGIASAATAPRELTGSTRDLVLTKRSRNLLFAFAAVAFVVGGVTITMGLTSHSTAPFVEEITNDSLGGSALDEELAEQPDAMIRKAGFGQVVTYLLGSNVSSMQDFELMGTPQNLAAAWLAEQDGANLDIPNGPVKTLRGYQYLTRYVLAVFYFATGGENWKNQGGFMSVNGVCEWNMVTSDGNTQGVVCDDDSGVIFGIDLSLNNLLGTIPAEIGLLPSLEGLSLNMNGIAGELPASMCDLLHLEMLELAFNSLVGSMPECIGSLSALEFLFLSHNQLSGTLPVAIGTLTKMEAIIVDDNLFTGNVTNYWDEMTDLKWLHLADNDFSGMITDDFLVSQTNLVQLDLSSNSFEGKLPVHLLGMPQLQLLDLHDNRLTNNIPPNIQRNERLVVVAIHQNAITGPLPPGLVNLRALVHLDVSDNQITGTFPSVMSRMTGLEYFFASANNFDQGPIPGFITSLVNLQELGLKSTQRNETIPMALGSLQQLTMLDLDNNSLVGGVPSELGQLIKLQFLLLNRNDLTGSIPVEFSSLTSLRAIYMDSNSLTGSLSALCGLPSFQAPSEESEGMQLITADCGGDNPEIECVCCTTCCDDETQGCNKNTEVASIDPNWDEGDTRRRYITILGDETAFFAF